MATRDGMWQVRLLDGSAFRLHLAVNRWRGVAAAPGRGTAAPAFEAQEEAARTPKEAAS